MKLNSVFTDNVILQANKPVRFFGTGEGSINIEIGDKKYSYESNSQKWMFEGDTFQYSGPYEIRVTTDEESYVISNVLFGDVFFLSGQSNMAFKLGEERPVPELKRSDNLRYYFIDIPDPNESMSRERGWEISTNSIIELWSCLGYHFGQKYEEFTGHPVGLVCAAQGASTIQSWIEDDLLDDTVYVPVDSRHHDSVEPLFAIWNKDSMLYHFCIEEIAPLSCCRVLWYQGESNTSDAEAEVYTLLLAKLIDTFRKAFMDDLEFTVVEICDFDPRDDAAWHNVQKAQQRIVEIRKSVDVIKSSDLTVHTDIHPATKEALADRILKSITEKWNE